MLLLIPLIFGYLLWWAYFRFAYTPRNVRGQTVLITGGASGIGRLMALRFATLGARIVLWDRQEALLQEVKAEVEKLDTTCTTGVIDVTNREAVYEAARKVGAVDILVLNAGIVSGKKFLEIPDEEIERTYQVNCLSHFWALKAFLPGMIQRNSGRVVSIASVAGLFGNPGQVDYSSSKFAAVGIADSLYTELKRQKSKVGVTLVCPYYINTGMFDGVKSNNLLLPILDSRAVADRIVEGVRRGEERIILPGRLLGIYLLKMLPWPVLFYLASALGLMGTMDDFKGRAGTTKK